MIDLQLAKKILEEKNLTLAIVKEGEIIFTSTEKGIKPMYTAILEHKDEIKGASIADRVIGRAAAILCKYAEIKALHTKLISEQAISVFKDTTIEFYYDESTPYIKNRDKTDMCPVEKLSQDVDSNAPEELIEKITDFLDKIKKRV